MAEKLDIDFSFDRPIPGENLTAELGSRPWQTPAQFTTVDDALGFYIPRMAQDEFSKGLLNVMEMGVPLTTIANTIMISGVMEGRHSVDVGILSIPAIVETMKLIGDSANVEYVTGMEKGKGIDDNVAKMVAAKMVDVKEEEQDVSLPEQENVEKPALGIMSRRNADV